MKQRFMPHKFLGFVALLALAFALPLARAQDGGEPAAAPAVPLAPSVSQGYLGVQLADVDQRSAQALKLKEVRGAVITMIDHDAPAGKIGLKVNDVVVKLNTQPVEGAEQLRRRLREIPAGRKVTIEISRDGKLLTLAAELADRGLMEQDVWNRIGGDGFEQGTWIELPPDSSPAPPPGGFHLPFFGSSLRIGALVEPLTRQMAEYLGVPGGLIVRQVAQKSAAAAAGLRAFDVIIKVGPNSIATMADWERALRTNQGKTVEVTVLRDRKPQTLTLQIDIKHHSELVVPQESPEVGD